MIDSISTSPVQSSALRSSPQSPSSVEVAETAVSTAALPTTRIRVDNALNRAIIEVRSSDGGQVLRQYPTEAQLRAFARAEALKLEQQNEPSQPSRAPVRTETSSPAPQAKAAAPAAPVSTPAPAAANPSAYSGSVATSGVHSQSIDV